MVLRPPIYSPPAMDCAVTRLPVPSMVTLSPKFSMMAIASIASIPNTLGTMVLYLLSISL